MKKQRIVLPVPTSVAANQARLRSALLRWFAGHQRDLPWRRTKDPYAIWVSEIMLQQTQVDRVIEYFKRFIARFPTVRQLASAPLDEVLALWSGLGYYSRARNLHRAAQLIAAQSGTLPAQVGDLEALPGFGRYTAGAVASIAFDLPAPLVDGNVARVFARLFEIEGAAGDRTRDDLMWNIASTLVDPNHPGDFNQALMELGATVCTPMNPECSRCPVAPCCEALKANRVAELPKPKAATKKKHLRCVVALATRRDQILLARRNERGLFGGLWELPCGESLRSVTKIIGAPPAPRGRRQRFSRTLTHRELELDVREFTVATVSSNAPAPYLEWRWVPIAHLAKYGVSSATSAIITSMVIRHADSTPPPR